jgi:glycerol kinase
VDELVDQSKSHALLTSTDIHTLKYDDKLISFFDLDTKKIHLPEIVPSSHSEKYGKLTSGPLKGTRITGCLGDQSAALVGQCGFTPGRAKNTYGTGCFLLYNVGEKPVISTHGLLATVAFDFSEQGIPPFYALEGSIAVAGSSVKFLMNNLGFSRDSHKISELASTYCRGRWGCHLRDCLFRTLCAVLDR